MPCAGERNCRCCWGLLPLWPPGASSAEAQVTATAVLKIGQRHTGTNLAYRVDGRQVIVRTSQAEEPRIPVDQVAYVDFGGTPDPPNMNLSGSQEAVVMRDGSVQKGQILELGHTNKADLSSPVLVIFRTESGEERRLPSSQVARVYFAGGQPSSADHGHDRSGPPSSRRRRATRSRRNSRGRLLASRVNRGEVAHIRTPAAKSGSAEATSKSTPRRGGTSIGSGQSSARSADRSAHRPYRQRYSRS